VRPLVGVPAGDARRDVDDRGDLAPYEGIGSHPVKIGMINDRYLARSQALGQVLGPAIEASGGAHPGEVL
jgi:hypothetical protein